MWWTFASEQHYQAHCDHIELARQFMEDGQFDLALEELTGALAQGDSPNARWNRALTLLALGDYRRGFEDFEARHLLFPVWERTERLRRDLPRWRGEDLAGKRLVLIHEAGFGDTLQMLRYVPVLRSRGIDVALAMPDELKELASQLAPTLDEPTEYDVGCCMYDLMRLLDQDVDSIPRGAYLKPDPGLREYWGQQLGFEHRIGIAWSSMRTIFPKRNIALDHFLELLDAPRYCKVVSLQFHDSSRARGLGVVVPDYHDFADVAAMASLMDEIISIDTAVLHIAGAIGHPNVNAVLPYVQCWRWRNGNPWHPRINLCRQRTPGDWLSAFAQIRTLVHA